MQNQIFQRVSLEKQELRANSSNLILQLCSCRKHVDYYIDYQHWVIGNHGNTSFKHNINDIES